MRGFEFLGRCADLRFQCRKARAEVLDELCVGGRDLRRAGCRAESGGGQTARCVAGRQRDFRVADAGFEFGDALLEGAEVATLILVYARFDRAEAGGVFPLCGGRR